MAVEVIETFAGLEENAMTQNGMIGVQRFIVKATAPDSITPANVFNHPIAGAFLPQLNDAMSFQGYVLYASGFQAIQTVSPNTIECRVSFDDILSSRREEVSTLITDENYPIYVKEPYTGAIPLSGNPTTNVRWRPETWLFKSSAMVLRVDVPLVSWGMTEREKILEETGRYHRIGERVYRFQGGNLQQLSTGSAALGGTGRWLMSYSWIADNGFFAPETFQQEMQVGNQFILPNGIFGGGINSLRYERLPFELYTRVPGIDRFDPPTIKFVPAPDATPISSVNLPKAPWVIIF